ncbi:putative bifunctional diguanylate cyclase/phosphodiesterase [Algicola sagamiensis]|uniref:putative bifunctional diguanylate cyclase/phosphodiesterase n=1 Tax=Algicola sagamiensis TaxID=163869 RepID=UPI000365CDA8|nr:bifunctional diguanylate cyclase/phosphodiesterase [Algicola sagamiensis]
MIQIVEKYRHFIPIAVFLLGLFISGNVFFRLNADQSSHLSEGFKNELFKVKTQLSQQLAQQALLVKWFSESDETIYFPTRDQWSNKANSIIKRNRHLKFIAYVNSRQEILNAAPRKIKQTLDKDSLIVTSSFALLKSSSSREPNLLANEKDLVLISPIIDDYHTVGLIMFSYNSKSLFENMIRSHLSENYQLEIFSNKDSVYQFYADKSLKEDWGNRAEITFNESSLIIDLWPTQERIDVSWTDFQYLALYIGILLTGILSFLSYLLLATHYKSLELNHANLALKKQVEENEKVQQQLSFLAEHDPITSLSNRRAFERELEEKLKSAISQGENLVVYFLDLDHFADINNALGYNIGNSLLNKVAERLAKIMPQNSLVCRFSGDEFGVMFYEITDQLKILQLADQILKALDTRFIIESYDVYVTSSIGVAIAPLAGEEADLVIRRAEQATAQAKRDGRNRYHFYTSDLDEYNATKLEVNKRLRSALSKNEIIVYYQPKVEMESGRIIGVESLVRWVDHDGSLILPAEFIPIAEDTGLILPIGEYVVKTACEQLAKWHHLGFTDLSVSVNVSSRQLQSPHFTDVVMSSFTENEIPQGKLEIEFTEEIFVENVQFHLDFLNSLKNHGIRVSIDDFGIGYSSLAYLKNSSIDCLKIDRSFIANIPSNREDSQITQTIITLAKNLGLDVIAEGVETQEQVHFLIKNGCVIGQGFHYCKPMSADDLTKLLLKHSQHIPTQF